MIINEKNSNLSMTRGDSEVITVEMRDESGVQIPFSSGDTVYFTIKTDANTSTKILQKTITTFTSGMADISIIPTDTSSLSYGKYYYDIQWNKADGTKKTIVLPSEFLITSEVTYE